MLLLSFLTTSVHTHIPNVVSLRLAVELAPQKFWASRLRCCCPTVTARHRVTSTQSAALPNSRPRLALCQHSSRSSPPCPTRSAFLTRLVVRRLGSCAFGNEGRPKSRRNKQANPACYAALVLRASEVPPVKLISAVRPSDCLLSSMRIPELHANAPELQADAPETPAARSQTSLVLPHHPEGVPGVQPFRAMRYVLCHVLVHGTGTTDDDIVSSLVLKR